MQPFPIASGLSAPLLSALALAALLAAPAQADVPEPEKTVREARVAYWHQAYPGTAPAMEASLSPDGKAMHLRIKAGAPASYIVFIDGKEAAKGQFAELISDEGLIEKCKNDYLKVILTDDRGILDAMAKLQAVFGNVMTLEYEYMRRQDADVTIDSVHTEGTPRELFEALYGEQHGGKEMDDFQKEVLDKLIAEVFDRQEAEDEAD